MEQDAFCLWLSEDHLACLACLDVPDSSLHSGPGPISCSDPPAVISNNQHACLPLRVLRFGRLSAFTAQLSSFYEA
jgi:hypothetical protein